MSSLIFIVRTDSCHVIVIIQIIKSFSFLFSRDSKLRVKEFNDIKPKSDLSEKKTKRRKEERILS